MNSELQSAPIECTSHDGVTIGLCDAIMTMFKLLYDRLERGEDDLPDAVEQALEDLRDYTSLRKVMGLSP